MNPKSKIAIYSGEIPSTTFIERLIVGLSNKDCEILLFGRIKKNVNYNNNVENKGYRSGKFQKGIYLIYYSTLLLLFRNKDKRKLDQILKAQSRVSLYDKVKYYPVLWHKPDIFHIQWAKGLSEWMWVKAFGIKLVLSLRGAHINYSPIADSNLAAMYNKNFPHVDAFHAVSHDIAKEAQKYSANAEMIKVVYSGLDLSLMNLTAITKAPQSSVFNIISVGRPHWIKGYVYALDACKILKNHKINFTYNIIGGANLELIYQIKELGLDNEITIIDKLPFVKVQEHIQKSDLLLLPSNEEGVANVVLEAMAMGTLVLTTDCGGMDEVVIDGINGFVTPIRDARKMAEKLLEISQISKSEKSLIASKAIETILKQHTDEKMVSDMLDLYRSL